MTPPEAPTGPAFPTLFSPLRIGSVTLRNRIFSSGHDTVMADHGRVSDQLVAYQEARAAGGVGLIVIQVGSVHPTAEYTAHALALHADDAIPGYARLAEAIHRHGCPVFAQIFHGGRGIMDSLDGSLPVAFAPSAVPTERFHVMPRAMPLRLIEDVVAGYAAAARRVQAAGMDGVEIVASHGYLPAQFLNPRVNLRTDRYGGSLDNRLRFLREIIAAVRAEVDREFVVGLRISIVEMEPEGITEHESLGALRELDADGSLDYVSVVAGSTATLAGSDHIVPPMTMPNAYTAPLAALAKGVVRVPVLVAGRVNQPQEAERIVATGQADAVAMTRALISDPLLPIKSATGRAEEIRACIGCNQACIGHFHAGYPISCIQYPESGREVRYGRRTLAAEPRDVLVVGGGPAGLKAAAVAAARGHRVTLAEAARRVGGQVLLAERLPDRAEFGGLITNLAAEAVRAGARILTGTAVDLAFIDRERPDVVILATGARPRRPPLELSPGATVLDAWEVVRGAHIPDGRIVVADWRCDWVGLGVAIQLGRAGHPVVLGSTGTTAGERIQQYVRDAMIAAAERVRVARIPLVRIFGYDGSAAFLQHVLTGDAVVVEDVAALVLALGHEPVDELAHALLDYPGEVHAIGDCLAPRTAEEAVLEGLRVASAI
ncbi:MAG TPA: FAD-dependent oxidoreductase [Candidatus Sulfomarinibacteraceae bacterium]|nr:FAD-dependent oxidoreductase [Candidatus Sulfomarinibacteraceae bacterium]